MAHIVILGAGLGGLSMAYAMRKAARHDDRVTVVAGGQVLAISCRSR
ncbi:NAD(P)-binding protein [Paraburkholderia kururiensis]|uniref:NAD(P)-binding protein n=1 Tax=Paraburkholderia kururiensis TaxID=984307 RepID=A0ABZ0WTA1_9BURK|nr:NAD(P)-binding protein [Paraburkholderia kururiensis]WQD80639.1 NAD(P)-binding protein [Paraburkholderia kururiensis]